MIPLATTTVAIDRPDTSATDDPYVPTAAPAAASRVLTGVRAVISAPSGIGATIGGEQQVVEWRLDTDPIALRQQDTVTDESTGEVYQVVWSGQRTGFGLDHTVAGLRKVEGEAP